MTTLVHINRPRGHYIGQIRRRGARTWQTVTRPRRAAEPALATAIMRMTPNHKRARVLFVDDSGWYRPNVVMEACR